MEIYQRGRYGYLIPGIPCVLIDEIFIRFVHGFKFYEAFDSLNSYITLHSALYIDEMFRFKLIERIRN